jgi:hypothetical protein
LATDNIFAGTITCTGLTVNGTITVTGAIASSTGFVGPFLSAASAAGLGTTGNPVSLIATAGTDGTLTAGVGGVASVTAGNGGNALVGGSGGNVFVQAGSGGVGSGGTGGSGGTATLQAGAGGATNANGGNVNLAPGAGAGTGRNGEVRVNNSTAGFIPVTFNYYAGAIDTSFFIASRAYRVRSIILRVDVTAGAGITAQIKKAASGIAINAGTLLSSTVFALDGAAFTNQVGALSATPADLDLAAGDAIGIDFTGAVAVGAAGSVTVTLAPV